MCCFHVLTNCIYCNPVTHTVLLSLSLGLEIKTVRTAGPGSTRLSGVWMCFRSLTTLTRTGPVKFWFCLSYSSQKYKSGDHRPFGRFITKYLVHFQVDQWVTSITLEVSDDDGSWKKVVSVRKPAEIARSAIRWTEHCRRAPWFNVKTQSIRSHAHLTRQ